MRAAPALAGAVAVLALAGTASAAPWHPPGAWMAQAQCIHRHEGAWTANTGNGYFGGMQIATATWRRVRGPADPAFTHPGDPAFPFAVSAMAQLHVAWLIWQRDGQTWRSWGATGRACSA